VFPLLSVAEQATTVRPTLKRLPVGGRQETGTAPSVSSSAERRYLTCTRFTPPGATTFFVVAPRNGAPGLRWYHPNYYGGYVLDPEGNNIEAVCHQPS
jgi:hypothetical protein